LPPDRFRVRTSRRSQVDIGEVYSFAGGFASAVVANDVDLIASYLCEDLADDTSGHLAGVQRLPTSSLKSEVLVVRPLGGDFDPAPATEFVSLTSFSGAQEQEDVLVRAVWVEEPQLLIRTLQIFELRPS
jgi:hypothetical protein